jgi:outer membrane receptor protein involved in Fe transport
MCDCKAVVLNEDCKTVNFKETLMIRSIRNLSVWVFVCLAALVLVSGIPTEAQTFRGTILGTVTDSSGLPVAGATVTVKNADTGLIRTVSTTDDGSYAAPELPIGNYGVTVEKSGFKSGVISGIRVEVSSERRADVVLQPGEIAQRVEVTGDTLPQVESTENTLGGIIESKVVTNLPVNGRDYQKLIFLVPGVTGSPDQITDSPGSFGIFSVNGARGRANNFLLDGTDMNDGYRNDPSINEAGVFGTPATILPVEAIAELRVASNFEAEYGRSAGGVINVVTKSGTNEWHGTGFEFFRNTVLNARNYFDPVGTPKQPFHNNQYGGALGGPIVHDKTFFFLDYEGFRERGKESSPACVPTAADISAFAPTPGNLASINPVIQNLLKINNGQGPWPQPTDPTTDCYVNGGTNAALATPFSNRVDSAIVKIDHNFNKDNLLTGRYYIGDSDQSFPLALTGGGLLPTFNTQTPTRVQLISLSYVSVLSPSVVNEARLGWNRFAEGFFPEDRTFNPSSIGLNTLSSSFGKANNVPYNYGLPFITVSGLANVGSDKGDPRQRVDTNWHYIDGLSWKAGRHDIKFGYEFRRTSITQIFNRGFRGTLSFANVTDPITGNVTSTSLQQFLAGTPNGGGSLRQGNTDRNTFENSYAGYFQDSYRWRKNVTVNLGLRYDYYGLIQDKNSNFTNVNPTTGLGFIVGQGRLYQPDYKNWAPRVSVAWDVTGKSKTVVRAGYGIFYDAFSQDMFMGHLPFNSGFDPGPAYSGFGPNPISSANANAGPFSASSPVYGFPSAMGDAFGVDQHLRTPYMENYNLNLQQELTRHMVLQVGYVGSQGHKLLRFRDINQQSHAEITAADVACNCINDFALPRHFTGSPFFYINYEEASANSIYNSLQTSWRINDWHGFTSTLNYTWSHSIDDASDGEDYVPNAAQPNDSSAPIGLNRGNSNFDVRNRLAWNFIYQFPNRKGSWQRLTDGWGLNGIVTVQSGQPFQLNYNFETADDFDGSGEGFGRPDVVGAIKYNQHDPNNFLDLTAFAVPCTVTASFTGQDSGCQVGSRHFGNEGRNSLLGPHFRQMDFSIFKNTAITERMKLELRFEAYNLFNHPNFANPYLPLFIADAAQNSFLSNGHSKGSFALTTTGDVGIGYPFLGSGGPRGLQVAAKITF